MATDSKTISKPSLIPCTFGNVIPKFRIPFLFDPQYMAKTESFVGILNNCHIYSGKLCLFQQDFQFPLSKSRESYSSENQTNQITTAEFHSAYYEV
jgi:hypothetical protein